MYPSTFVIVPAFGLVITLTPLTPAVRLSMTVEMVMSLDPNV